MSNESKPTILVTAVGAPPGFNLLRFLHESDKFNLIAGDANPWSGGLYYYQNAGVEPVVLPNAINEELYVEKLIEIAKKHNVNSILSGIENEIIVLSKHRNKLLDIGVKVLLPDHEVLTSGRSKAVSTVTAKELGLNIPKSLTDLRGSDSESSLQSIFEVFEKEVPLPWILKPVCGHGMHGVCKVESIKEAIGIITNSSEEFIAQEFIPGEVGSMYMVGLLYDQDGNCVRDFSSHSVKTLFPSGGPATAGVSKKVPEIIEKSKKILSKIGKWRGPAGIEWMLDPRDGEYKFIEINPRVWGYSSLATGSGSNFHESLGKLSIGQEIEPDTGFKEGVFMIRAPFDVILDELPEALR